MNLCFTELCYQVVSMACIQARAPLDLLGIDRVHVKHPDAQLQLRGHVVLLVLERASSRSLGLARA